MPSSIVMVIRGPLGGALPRERCRAYSTVMPNVEFSDEEHAAVTAVVRRSIADDRYPLSPRLVPLKSALAKLDPTSAPKPLPERVPPPEAPARHRGGRRARR